MKKHRFRKMYFICEDKRIIEPDVEMVYAYQFKEQAETIMKQRVDRRTSGIGSAQQSKHMPKLSVEEFRLVPAILFKELLGPFADE